MLHNALPPDHAEEDLADEIDNIVPSRGYQMLPVVGLGGSAGSIPALRAFFQSLPPDSGMAFVVVLHLSPEHESVLAELLQRTTTMKVMQVQGTEQLEPNTVYVIPPRKGLKTMDGTLRLFDLPTERSRHIAVDHFFRTLADSHGPHASAVILSGIDGDGAIGLKRVKERGGLTIAQDPAEAEFDSMPRTAIGTGMVDWVLPVADMPSRLLEYHRRERNLRLPPEDAPPADQTARSGAAEEALLRDVLTFLRTRTGRDFSYYKRATIVRRIGRRMQVNGIDDLAGYINCLRTQPGEATALLQDLLISVTNFFRDADCFAALEGRLPELFRDKGHGDTVRVWVAACATGEEAYTVAMLMNEYARTLDAPPVVQVFATDLDEEAIRIAREGIYPVTLEADVSEERLRRYFIKEHRGYRVRREIRETVLFAMHDLLKDSPFSRLDLVSCRNLLIYLNREAQARARHLPLRAQAARPALPRLVGIGRRRQLALHGGGQEAPPVPPAAGATQRAAGAGGPGQLCAAAGAAVGCRLAARGRPQLRPERGGRTAGAPASGCPCHLLGRSAPAAARAAGTALGAGGCRIRHPAPVALGGPLPAVQRRRAQPQPPARGAPGAAHRAAGCALPVCPDRQAHDRAEGLGRHARRGRAGLAAGRAHARHRAQPDARELPGRSAGRRAARRRRRRRNAHARPGGPPARPRDRAPESAPARHRGAIRSVHRGAQGQQRRTAGHERGAALGHRGARDEPRGAAVHQRGADHRQPRAQEHGRRARARQQRPAQPDGCDGHCHRLP
jgi:chemotaxis methyl-accepting protein methylase